MYAQGRHSLRVQYEELSWSLRQVENLTVLLPRLLSDTSGHYLVLFESAAYQEKLGTELEQLLRTVDPAVRFYAADHACFADSAAVETFLSDTAPGPKVLLCVNAPGVQQPLEGLAGVILVRQSSLMSTFKQMLCRALVAAGSRSVPVFDLVAQFEGLGNGRTLQRDCTEAMTRAGSKTPGFRQERPMQQTYRLYGKLRREMEARWEVLCQAAADASAKEGTLELPGAIPSTAACRGQVARAPAAGTGRAAPGRLTAEQPPSWKNWASAGTTGWRPPGKKALPPRRNTAPSTATCWCRCATAIKMILHWANGSSTTASAIWAAT